MGKQIAWDYIQHYARAVPGTEFNQSELRADFPNGGQVRIYGADSPDGMRGIYLDGAVFDEFGMQPPKTYSEVVAATLVDRGGWALFCGTPNGKNQFFEIWRYAHDRQMAGDKDWMAAEYKASQTGLLDEEYLAQARAVMTPDEYAQEFECSFEASVRGAIYARELEAAREAGRMTSVPYESALPVDTDWDLGIGDATSVWFSQRTRTGEVRIIDYYESSGEALPHYIGVLQQRGYVYGEHWAPHDIQVRELGSGKSRLETAASLGVKFRVTPNIGLEDGINAARMLLPRCWFDAERCKHGIDALMHYRRSFNERLGEFKAVPVHDHSSHGADAFRGLAVRMRPAAGAKSVVEPFRSRVATGTGWMAG